MKGKFIPVSEPNNKVFLDDLKVGQIMHQMGMTGTGYYMRTHNDQYVCVFGDGSAGVYSKTAIGNITGTAEPAGSQLVLTSDY